MQTLQFFFLCMDVHARTVFDTPALKREDKIEKKIQKLCVCVFSEKIKFLVTITCTFWGHDLD